LKRVRVPVVLAAAVAAALTAGCALSPSSPGPKASPSVATQSPSPSTEPSPSQSPNTPATLPDIGPNLLVNGNADAAAGSTDGSTVPIPGWTVTGAFTANSWDITDTGFLQRTDAGPADRGANYFAGGPANDTSSASQTVSLTSYASAIATGGEPFQLTGWLGGWETQEDAITVTLRFLDASGKEVGEQSLGPVTGANRDNASGLVYEPRTGTVPAGSATALVTMTSVRADGSYNDGYLDDLSLELK
jgi:hypothetical protein